MKKYKEKFNSDDEEPNNYIKWFKLFALFYLTSAFLFYEYNREKALPMTIEEVLLSIKKGEATEIHVLKMVPEKEEDSDEGRKKERETNFRKVYLRVEGIEYVANVPEIPLFYEKIKDIEKSKTTPKVKIFEKEMVDPAQVIRKNLSNFTKMALPIIIPYMLLKSSAGKVFQSKFIQSNSAFRPDVKFKDIAGLGNAKI